jgi:hypothetical protein
MLNQLGSFQMINRQTVSDQLSLDFVQRLIAGQSITIANQDGCLLSDFQNTLRPLINSGRRLQAIIRKDIVV